MRVQPPNAAIRSKIIWRIKKLPRRPSSQDEGPHINDGSVAVSTSSIFGAVMSKISPVTASAPPPINNTSVAICKLRSSSRSSSKSNPSPMASKTGQMPLVHISDKSECCPLASMPVMTPLSTAAAPVTPSTKPAIRRVLTRASAVSARADAFAASSSRRAASTSRRSRSALNAARSTSDAAFSALTRSALARIAVNRLLRRS